MEMREYGDETVNFRIKHPRDSLSDEERLEEIRQIAYDSYEQKGRLPGTEFASWLEAAQIVKGREEYNK